LRMEPRHSSAQILRRRSKKRHFDLQGVIVPIG
jgi:hypothetical protein